MRTSGFLRLFVYLSISSLASSILAAGDTSNRLGTGVHWQDLDEELSIRGIVVGCKSV